MLVRSSSYYRQCNTADSNMASIGNEFAIIVNHSGATGRTVHLTGDTGQIGLHQQQSKAFNSTESKGFTCYRSDLQVMRVCGWWSEGRMLRMLVVKVAVVCGEEYSKASARAGRSCPAPQLQGKGAWEAGVARLGSCHR